MTLRRKIKYIAFVVAAALAALLVWQLVLGSTENEIPVNLPPAAEQSEQPQNPNDSQDSAVQIDTATVQTAIATLTRPNAYSRTLEVTRYWSGGSETQTLRVMASGSSIKVQIPQTKGEKHILIVDSDLWIWHSGGGSVFHGIAEENDGDEFQSIPTYEDILELDVSAITDAGYLSYNGEYCIFAQYTSGAFGYTSRAYISVSSGLLVGCETYDGDDLVYSVISSELSLQPPDDSVFTPPPA